MSPPVSFWWRQLGGMPGSRPSLPGPLEADVAIVGAGYTGLWTAWYLARARPDWRIVVLEREVAGFGASGRNGGWLSGLLAGSRERWAAVHGREPVIAAQREMFRTVDEVADVCRREAIDCDLVKGGCLRVATSATQLRRLQELLAYERSWEFGEDDVHGLSPEAAAERVAVRGLRGALFTPHCARVHPAKLLSGLARAAERAGVSVFERTPVTRIAPGRADTPRGTVRARWVLRATEGYTAGLPALRRALIPMNSAMIVTEPLPEAAWEEIGWQGEETMRDAAHVYFYAQKTADGRIAIGGRGIPYRFGSRTDRHGEIPARTVQELRRRLAGLFPMLHAVPVTQGWCGVLGVPRDWCPSAGVDRRSGLGWAGGYVGDGVSTANLAGRTLRDLVLGEDTQLTRLPWVNHRTRGWEPEPLRFAAIRSVYGLYKLADRMETRTGRASAAAAIADRLSGR